MNEEWPCRGRLLAPLNIRQIVPGRGASRRPLHILFFTLLMSSAHCLGAESLAQQAQTAWQERDKLGQTEKAIELWQQSLKSDPTQSQVWISLAKAMGRAVRHAGTADEKRRWADQAKVTALIAAQNNPTSSEAYATLGEALGQWADAHKGIHSLSTVRQAVEALHQALKLNPENAYAHMLLASFYREAPGVISVGDKEKAYAHAKLAVQYGPDSAINHLVLAKIEIDRGQKDQAINELQAIMSLTPPDNSAPETHADQETAQKMLQDLGVAPIPPPCGQTGGYCSDPDHP
jgi:tetratricopeptide (TPR) repeat protein